MRVILLNGPPRSGKDTSANIIEKILGEDKVFIWGFSYHLKRFVHGIYLGDYGWNLPPNHFDDIKDEPQEILNGKSWRQMYIHHSENAIKPLHGKQWFGKMFLKITEEEAKDKEYLVVPDNGFYDESVPVIEKYDAKNIIQFQIYRDGCDFSNDSRSYVDLTGFDITTVKLYNNFSLAALKESFEYYIKIL